MSAPPYIPFFGADYLRDTQLLSIEEHGAYFLLMLSCWQQDDCSLPDEDPKLARICRVTPREWKKIRPVMAKFWTIKNGRWTNNRLKKERKIADEKSEAARTNARKRWSKQTTENKQSGVCEGISGGICDGISSASSTAEQPQPQLVEPNGSTSVSREEVETIRSAWNAMANRSGLPTWSKTSPKRLAACRARIRDEGVDRILQATERIPQSSFLRGATGNWSGASVEFFLRPDTVTRILEGKYDDRSRPSDDSNGDRRDGFTRAIHHDIAARRSRPAADETRQPDAGDDRDDRERAAPRLTGV